EIHAELAHRLEREADVCPLRLRQEGLDERTGTARRLLPGERARRPGQHEEAARSELGRRPEVRAATPERAALARRVTEGGAARDATTSHAPTDAGSSPRPRCWRPGWASSSARARSTGRPGRTRGSAPSSAACSTTRTGCSTFAGAAGAGDRRARENLDAS